MTHNKKFKADTGSRPVRFKQLLCGRRHKHRRVGRVFYYGNARGVGGGSFELEIYLQNLEIYEKTPA